MLTDDERRARSARLRSSDPLPATIERDALRKGRRAFARFLAWLLPLGAVTGFVAIFLSMRTVGRAFEQRICDGCQSAPRGSALWRDGTRLAAIKQVAEPSAARVRWMILAPARGAEVDSLRAGLLAAMLSAGGVSGALWTVELIQPQPEARGEVVALLVTAPGMAPVPVYASPATAP